jgi:hypothetical protein
MGSLRQDLRLHLSRRTLLDVFLILLLWPVLMIFPSVPEIYLDASWQETLVYAHTHGWQFGRDLIFTWGPWGFLNGIFHLGDAAAVTRLGWELGGKLLLAVGLVAGTRQLSPVRHAVFAVACALCLPVFQDSAYLLFITVAVLAGLLRPGVPRGVMLIVVVALAFLAQIKFTYALLAAIGVGLAGAAQLSRRRWPDAGLLGGGFVLAFTGWWLAAGQNPDNIVPYLRRSWEVSSGYADAMGADESRPVFLCGLTVLAFHGVFVWRIWRRQPDRALAAGMALFLAAVWFLVWKHGFTRADGHVMGFFFYALPAALVLPVLCFPEVRRWSWLDLAMIPCLAGLWFFEPGLPLKLPAGALSRLEVNVLAAWHITTLPAAWRAELERARIANALPAVRRAAGDASVDVFNYEQGVALLNGLNFAPRPVFQGYSAYSSRLAGRNLQHYQSAAPAFLLWHHSSIDDRFPTLDDAPLIAELPRAYRPVLTEGDFLLLQRTGAFPTAPLARELLHRQTVALGESLPVPAVSDCALWVQVFADATQLGRLRALLYRPAMLTLTVEEVTGRQTTWRLLPRVAEDGFLLQPFLETQSDFAAYLRGRGRKQIRSLRIDAPAGESEFWKGAEVRFHALRGLPIENDAAYLELVEQGLTNVAPCKVTAPAPLAVFPLGPHKAVLLHAPATMEFAVPAGTTRLSAGFGLRPGAYDDGGNTDGVEFRVIANWSDGRTEILWRRWLDPVHHSVDRGVQQMEITLPANRPATVILQTDPGPAGNTQWDWSYWTQIKFSPAPMP